MTKFHSSSCSFYCCCCWNVLGLLRDAEKQLKSSIKIQPIIGTYLELCNVYLRLDLPNTALDILNEAYSKFTAEPRLLIGLARIYDLLNDADQANTLYKKALTLDASNIEAIACLGAHSFYADQVSILLDLSSSTACCYNVYITIFQIDIYRYTDIYLSF